MLKKEDLTIYAKSIGVDHIGFGHALPFQNHKKYLLDKIKRGYSCSLEYTDSIKKAIDPQQVFKGAKTFIVILESYGMTPNYEHTNVNANTGTNALRGMISVASIFEDYHKIIQRKLDALKIYIEENSIYGCQTFCDQGPFSDRAVALRAGFGNVGKNGFVIHEKYGTQFYIGYLLTDWPDETSVNTSESACNADRNCENTAHSQKEPFTIPENIAHKCKTCNKCIDACPSKAIIGDGSINSNRCISYLTQSKSLALEEKIMIGNKIYGCDICQQVCPYNADIENKKIKPLIYSNPTIESILSINNREFKNSYGQTSAGWRGKKHFQKNSIIALGNSKSNQAVELLKVCINDQRQDIKLEAIAALIKLNSKEAITVLKEHLQYEENSAIREKIVQAINAYKSEIS